MNSRELLKATVAGTAHERVPVTGWWHMPLEERTVTDFTRATIRFTDYNGFDFIKAMYNGFFMNAAYGGEIEYSCDRTFMNGHVTHQNLLNPHDYAVLEPLEVEKTSLVDQLEFTRNLVNHYKGEIPVLATVFTPLSFLKEMACAGNPHSTQEMMLYNKKELHHALEAMTETCIRFIKALLPIGIDGIFFAEQFASSDLLTREQYDEFCRPYNMKVLEALKGSNAWFNMLHFHGNDNLMFDKAVEYPVEAINWEDSSGDPALRTSIKQAREMTDKVLIGGVDHTRDFYSKINDREAIKDVLKRRLETAIEEAGMEKFIFAPGCGFPNDVNGYEFTLMREVVDEMFGMDSKRF